MYGIYVITGKNIGWLMENWDDPALFNTSKDAQMWLKEWTVHKDNYEVRKYVKPRRNKNPIYAEPTPQDAPVVDLPS